jgi:hypothetical protein
MGWISHQTEQERQALNERVFHTYEVLFSLGRMSRFLHEAELDHAEILFFIKTRSAERAAIPTSPRLRR